MYAEYVCMHACDTFMRENLFFLCIFVGGCCKNIVVRKYCVFWKLAGLTLEKSRWKRLAKKTLAFNEWVAMLDFYDLVAFPEKRGLHGKETWSSKILCSISSSSTSRVR